MAVAFTDAQLIQSDSGTAGTGTSGPTSATVSLPTGTTDGSTVLVFMRNLNFAAIADVWDVAVQQNGVPSLSIYARVEALAGESSWTLTAITTSAWAWRVEEWANISSAPYISTTSAAAIGTSATSLASGNTASFTGEQFWMAVAVVSLYKGSTDSQVFPSVALSDGFTIVQTVDNGTGTTGGDQRLVVARRYSGENEDGPLSTTATFTGNCTNISSQLALAVFRAQDTVLVDPPTFT